MNAQNLLDMLNAHRELITQEYPRNNVPFTLEDCQQFIDGQEEISNDWRVSTTAHKIRQAISVIGAHLVDRNKADPSTKLVYKATWEISIVAKCQYCNKNFNFKMMMGRPTHCQKSRCVLNAMRDQM